jgi:hypothetical protein
MAELALLVITYKNVSLLRDLTSEEWTLVGKLETKFMQLASK